MKRFGPWPAWLAAVLVSFGALEAAALRRNAFPPLSAYLRHLLGITPRRPLGRFAPAAFVAFWAWLTVHLIKAVEES